MNKVPPVQLALGPPSAAQKECEFQVGPFSLMHRKKVCNVVAGNARVKIKRMLPLSLLKTAQNHPMLVELKNGETYNGHLVSCDNWMNINLREVICTSRDGDKFWRMPECYIRGSTIKYLRIPDEIIDMVKEEVVSKGRGRGGMQQNKQQLQQKGRGAGGAGRGVFGGRGRGMAGAGAGGRGQQEKKPGKPPGGKSQH
ncbi:UNVERIFIED_CONTAM: hypothetical protein FKN15_062994 [Acipenser sinensis]